MRFITTLFILGLSFFSSATALATENQQKKTSGPSPDAG
jgi:hypothetical protein